MTQQHKQQTVKADPPGHLNDADESLMADSCTGGNDEQVLAAIREYTDQKRLAASRTETDDKWLAVNTADENLVAWQDVCRLDLSSACDRLDAWRKSPCGIQVVIGPPACGKSRLAGCLALARTNRTTCKALYRSWMAPGQGAAATIPPAVLDLRTSSRLVLQVPLDEIVGMRDPTGWELLIGAAVRFCTVQVILLPSIDQWPTSVVTALKRFLELYTSQLLVPKTPSIVVTARAAFTKFNRWFSVLGSFHKSSSHKPIDLSNTKSHGPLVADVRDHMDLSGGIGPLHQEAMQLYRAKQLATTASTAVTTVSTRPITCLKSTRRLSRPCDSSLVLLWNQYLTRYLTFTGRDAIGMEQWSMWYDTLADIDDLLVHHVAGDPFVTLVTMAGCRFPPTTDDSVNLETLRECKPSLRAAASAPCPSSPSSLSSSSSSPSPESASASLSSESKTTKRSAKRKSDAEEESVPRFGEWWATFALDDVLPRHSCLGAAKRDLYDTMPSTRWRQMASNHASAHVTKRGQKRKLPDSFLIEAAKADADADAEAANGSRVTPKRYKQASMSAWVSVPGVATAAKSAVNPLSLKRSEVQHKAPSKGVKKHCLLSSPGRDNHRQRVKASSVASKKKPAPAPVTLMDVLRTHDIGPNKVLCYPPWSTAQQPDWTRTSLSTLHTTIPWRHDPHWIQLALTQQHHQHAKRSTLQYLAASWLYWYVEHAPPNTLRALWETVLLQSRQWLIECVGKFSRTLRARWALAMAARPLGSITSLDACNAWFHPLPSTVLATPADPVAYRALWIRCLAIGQTDMASRLLAGCPWIQQSWTTLPRTWMPESNLLLTPHTWTWVLFHSTKLTADPESATAWAQHWFLEAWERRDWYLWTMCAQADKWSLTDATWKRCWSDMGSVLPAHCASFPAAIVTKYRTDDRVWTLAAQAVVDRVKQHASAIVASGSPLLHTLPTAEAKAWRHTVFWEWSLWEPVWTHLHHWLTTKRQTARVTTLLTEFASCWKDADWVARQVALHRVGQAPWAMSIPWSTIPKYVFRLGDVARCRAVVKQVPRGCFRWMSVLQDFPLLYFHRALSDVVSWIPSDDPDAVVSSSLVSSFSFSVSSLSLIEWRPYRILCMYVYGAAQQEADMVFYGV
jgi:hypothetical protein